MNRNELTDEQLQHASARATLARMPVLNDPVISEAMAALEEQMGSEISSAQLLESIRGEANGGAMATQTYIARDGTRLDVADELVNPCVGSYGPGPAGERCGGCVNLRALHIATRPQSPDPSSKPPVQTLYYCCLDSQPKRATWPACDRFVEAPLAGALSP